MKHARSLPALSPVSTLAAGLAASVVLASASLAAPVTFPLEPGHSQVKLTGYGVGFIPNNGEFHDYKGTLTVDPDDINACKVHLVMQVKSLDMGMVTSTVLAKDFMDPETYPTTTFNGACKPGTDGPVLAGDLTVHGQTHPFELKVSFVNHVLTTTGTFKRTEWGITSHQGLIGNATKVTVITSLPDNIVFKNAKD